MLQIQIMDFKKILALLSLSACFLPVNAQPRTQKMVSFKLPTDTAIKTGKLTNGFTYFIRKNTKPAKRASLYLVVKAGSILENNNQLGLAHFMEHMSFDGTKHFPKKELIEHLQKSGVRFGADLNAYTSFDETVYQLPIPTDDPGLFAEGLQIIRDWAGEANLEPGAIDKERGVVLEEKRLHKGVNSRLQEKLIPFQYNGSRYAERIPIGSEQILTSFKKPDILSFYKDWYRPDLEGLIIVGDVDVNQVERQVKALFSGMKNPDKPKTRTTYKAPLLNRNRFLALTDPEISQTSIQFEYKRQQFSEAGTRAAYRATILNSLCGSLVQARLEELSRAPTAPVMSMSGGYGPVINGVDALTVDCMVKNKQLREGFNYIYNALRQISKFGFSESEINRVKKSFQIKIQRLVNEKDHQPSEALADELKRHFLKGESIPGIVYENKLMNEVLAEFTLEVVHDAIKDMISGNNRDITLFAPAADLASLPNERTINQWISEQPAVKLFEEGKLGDEKLLAVIPKMGKVVDEQQNQAMGLTIWTLSNGARVILKPTAFANDEIFFNAFSPGGSSLYPDSDYYTAANTVAVIASAGLGNHDNNQLSKLMTGKQAQVQPYINERFEGLIGMSTKADLETAMQLFYLRMTAPRKDSARFSQVISRFAQIIAGRNSSSQTAFQDTVGAVLGNNNIRRTGATMAKLNTVTLDKAYRIYTDRFSNAGNFTFVFTGSFTPEAMKPLVEQYIASIPGNGPHEKARDLGIRVPQGQLTKTIYAGKEDKASVILFFSGSFKFSADEQAKMVALKDVIQFRMLARLREKEGGVYSPSVSFSREHDTGDRYRYAINFGCAPMNVEKLIAAALQEIENLKQDGPTPEEMQKFSSEESRQLELNKESNDYWNGYLVNKLENNEDINSLLSQGDRIKKVSSADIKSAANAYVAGDNLIKFILLPEKK
jgi:zinc protease